VQGGKEEDARGEALRDGPRALLGRRVVLQVERDEARVGAQGRHDGLDALHADAVLRHAHLLERRQSREGLGERGRRAVLEAVAACESSGTREGGTSSGSHSRGPRRGRGTGRRTADKHSECALAALALGLLGILEERTGDHGAARRSHAVVVELEDLERGRIADELEPASVQEGERGRRGGGGEGVSCGAAKQGRRRSMEETTHMGSALLPPKALSLRSSEVRLGRVRSEVHRARRHCGISEMRRPVKTSLKSAVCCTCTRARSA